MYVRFADAKDGSEMLYSNVVLGYGRFADAKDGYEMLYSNVVLG
jgi:hypothetical protein